MWPRETPARQRAPARDYRSFPVKGHGTKFSRKMEAAVTALITQRNQEEAARAAGIGVATLVRWQKDPEFQKAYRGARRAVHQQSTARLQQATGAAVTTLFKVLVDPATPASVKVRAADSVLATRRRQSN